MVNFDLGQFNVTKEMGIDPEFSPAVTVPGPRVPPIANALVPSDAADTPHLALDKSPKSNEN